MQVTGYVLKKPVDEFAIHLNVSNPKQVNIKFDSVNGTESKQYKKVLFDLGNDVILTDTEFVTFFDDAEANLALLVRESFYIAGKWLKQIDDNFVHLIAVLKRTDASSPLNQGLYYFIIKDTMIRYFKTITHKVDLLPENFMKKENYNIEIDENNVMQQLRDIDSFVAQNNIQLPKITEKHADNPLMILEKLKAKVENANLKKSSKKKTKEESNEILEEVPL